MTNRTRALGHRILGTLKNERIVVVSNGATTLCFVSLYVAGATKPFAMVRENEWGEFYVMTDDGGTGEWHESFAAAMHVVKQASRYPTPKARRSFVKPLNRGTRVIGVKVG